MKESQSIEWKESWRDEYIKWICGFANAQGGVLVIGKKDSGAVIGVPKASKLLADIPNKVRDILGIIVDVNLKKEKKPYNPLIANVFFRTGLIESWGRGIEKIKN